MRSKFHKLFILDIIQGKMYIKLEKYLVNGRFVIVSMAFFFDLFHILH